MEKTSVAPPSSNFQLKECDFNQVCRCCLSRGNLLGELHTIQWKENDDKLASYLTIADLYKTFCNIQVKKWQKLPQYICWECVNVLTKFKLFTSKCRQVEDNLQKLHAKIQGDNLQITIEPLDVNRMTPREEICNDSNRQTVKKSVIPINIKTEPTDSPVDYSDEEENAMNCEEIETDIAQIQGGCLKMTVEPLNVKMTSGEEICNDSYQPIIKRPVLPINVKTEPMDYDDDCDEDEEAAQISTTLSIDYEEIKTEICNETSEIDQAQELPSSRCNIQGMFNDHTYSAPIPQPYILLTCQRCQAFFEDVRHIASHKLQMKHFDESGDKCDICLENLSEFDDCQTMTDHLTNHAEVSIRVKVNPRKGPFKCHLCDQMFQTYPWIIKHMENVHVNPKHLKCDFCSRTFDKKYRLRDHVRTHTGEKPHMCKLCDQRFATRREVRYHIHKDHPNNLEAFQDQNHVCVYCGDTFDRVQNLEIHLSLEHATRPPEVTEVKVTQLPDDCYECFLCRKRFDSDIKLNNHLRRHW